MRPQKSLRDQTFKALGKTGEAGNVIQILAEVSEVLLVRMTNGCTLFCVRDVLQVGRSGV
jgi:hypothetical protein